MNEGEPGGWGEGSGGEEQELKKGERLKDSFKGIQSFIKTNRVLDSFSIKDL